MTVNLKATESKRTGGDEDVRLVKRLVKRVVRDDPFGPNGPLDELSRRRTLDHIVESVETPIESVYYRRDGILPTCFAERPVLYWGAGIAASLAMFVATWFLLQALFPFTDTQIAPNELDMNQRSAVLLTENSELQSNGKTLKTGDQLPWNTVVHSKTGVVVIKPADGVLLAMEKSSELALLEEGSESVSVELSKGKIWVSVDPKKRRVPFSVVTSSGTVKVQGTVFSVDSSGFATDVEVLRGKVAFLGGGDEELLLTAGQRSNTKKMVAEQLNPVDSQSKWDRLVSLSLVHPDTLAVTTSDQQVEQVVGPNAADLRLTRDNPDDVESSIAQKSSIDSLLSDVRIFRKQRNWTQATNRYETLISLYPQSSEARTALVALGKIELDKFQRPSNALAYFEKYISRGGRTLLPEALYGKAQALRALGNETKEKDVLQSICQGYPGSLQAASSRKRLFQLNGARSMEQSQKKSKRKPEENL